MARRLKPQKVDDVKVGGCRLDIMLDRNDLTFFVEIDDSAQLRAGSVGELKQLVREKAPGLLTIEWQRVIKAQVGGWRRDSDVSVTLSYERFWLGRRSNGSFVQVNNGRAADPPEVGRAQPFSGFHAHVRTEKGTEYRCLNPEGKLPYAGARDITGSWVTGSTGVTYLPYADETWHAIEQIAQGLERAREQLEQIIGSEEGQAGLLALGAEILAKALPAPKEKP